MQKADKTVIRETKYIAVSIIILSILMELVFVLLSKWSYKVLLGNVLSGAAMVLNFYFMGLAVQKAVAADEKEARKIMKTSQSLRTMFIFIVAVIGVTVPCFSVLATIIPLFFTRIAIFARPLWKNKEEKEVPKLED